MNMSRVSYGSRAGGANDYPGVVIPQRRSALRGPCSSIDDLTAALRDDIDAGAESLVPECTTSELVVAANALVPLHRPNIGPYAEGGDHDLPIQFKASWTDPENSSTALNTSSKKSHPLATIQSIISIGDQQSRQIVQRAASRGIVAALERMDGFKYSFNNAWSAKDDDGQRFSYICQDSMQNKDRHANGFTRTQKHLKGEGERGIRKPTYDCKGSVSVKFSLIRGCVDVYYRHYAIHPTVTERKTAKPRPRPVQKQRLDVNGGAVQTPQSRAAGGGLLERLQAEESAFSAQPKMQQQPAAPQQHSSNIGKPLKRKWGEDTPMQSKTSGKNLSLVELLKQSESAIAPPPLPAPAKSKTHARPPPVTYDLPSWQKPDPAPVQRPKQAPKSVNRINAPYQPPYTPNHAPVAPLALQQVQHRSSAAQQEFFGPPKGHPQGQGLFATLKPVPQEPLISGWVPVQSLRAKNSCTHCRYMKRKVRSS